MGVGVGLLELVRDRLRKQGLYRTSDYWDMKASVYQGLARSNWPSNAYNELLHARQMARLMELLGDVRDLDVADVGCGTGRASLELAQAGARVTGFDFSPVALEQAREEAARLGLDVRFELKDAMEAPRTELERAFDVVLVLGCFTLACEDHESFDRALGHVVALLRPRGRLLFMEPIHRSRLLSRILRMSVGEWVEHSTRQGLELVDRDGILFVPARFALAFRELPPAVVRPVFRGGEHLLELSSRLDFLADYKILLFRRRE